jgi:heptosyltransferase III
MAGLRQPQNKILVIRGGAIGDFILTLPVLAALRQQFPASRLEVLGYPHIAQLALAGGLVDAVRSIEARPLAGFFAAKGTLAADLAEYFSEFAVIVSYLYDPDQVFQKNVALCSKAQFIAGPHRPDDEAGHHAAEVLLRPLERLAIFDADPVPRLEVGRASRLAPQTNRPEDRRNACPALALHLGSGSERKNWPEARWAELIRRLVDATDLHVLLVGGEVEGERLDRLADLIPPVRLTVARSLPLSELARQLSTCAGFAGHDSGITHLAAALGLPGVALWGESPEAVWRPRGETLRVLREPGGLPTLTVERVFTELLPLLQKA